MGLLSMAIGESGCILDGTFECIALLVLIILHLNGNDTGLPVSVYRTLKSWMEKVTSWTVHSSASTHVCPPIFKNATDSLALDQITEHTLAGTSSLQVLFPKREQEPESASLSSRHSMDDHGLVPVPNVTIPAAIMVIGPHAVSNPPTASDYESNDDDVSISLESLQSSVGVSQSMIPNSDKDGSSLYLFHSMSHASMGSSCSATALHVSLKLRDKIQRQCSSSSADSRPLDSPRRRRRLRRESSNDNHADILRQASISGWGSCTGSEPLSASNMDTCRTSPHRSPKRSPQRRSHQPNGIGPSDEVILQRLQRHAQLPL
jgi:hypothetical protein